MLHGALADVLFPPQSFGLAFIHRGEPSQTGRSCVQSHFLPTCLFRLLTRLFFSFPSISKSAEGTLYNVIPLSYSLNIEVAL